MAKTGRRATGGIAAGVEGSPSERNVAIAGELFISKLQSHNGAVRNIPPRLLEWTVKAGDTPKDVIARLEEKPEYWLIAVVDDNGRLKTVVEEEAFWRFVKAQMVSSENKEKTAQAAYEVVVEMTVQKVLEADELKRFRDRCVAATLDTSVGAVYESMQSEGLLLAVVSDENRKPTHFFTTADVRRVLLAIG